MRQGHLFYAEELTLQASKSGLEMRARTWGVLAEVLSGLDLAVVTAGFSDDG